MLCNSYIHTKTTCFCPWWVPWSLGHVIEVFLQLDVTEIQVEPEYNAWLVASYPVDYIPWHHYYLSTDKTWGQAWLWNNQIIMNHISLWKAGLCIQSHLQTHTLDASKLLLDHPMYLYCCLYTVAYSDWPTVFAIVCWQSSELFFPSG